MRIAFIIPFLFVTTACASTEVMTNQAAQHPFSIKVESGQEYSKYVGNDSGCSVIWRVSKKKAEVSLQSLCQSKPLAEQIPLIKETLEQAKLEKSSYSMSLCCFTELDREITLAAYQSPKWSSQKGYAKNNDSTGTVTQLINEAGIPTAITELFQSIGYEVKAKRTHRISRTAAKQTPYYAWLKERGVLEDAILPTQPVVYWKLTKLDSHK